jgi:acyl carrier protein
MKPDYFKATQEILCDYLGCPEEDVTMHAKIVEDLGADSLDTIDIIMAFEELYDIEIDEYQLAKESITVTDVIARLESMLSPSNDEVSDRPL